MSTPHIESQIGEIAPKVLLPGDPLRAKYIAEHYLENAVCINQIRGMLGYTGTYKGEKVTVFATGMGMPSMGIYAYELCKFYGAKEFIRIGTCGAKKDFLHLRDLILANESYTLSSYPYLFFDDKETTFASSETLNQKIRTVADKKNCLLHEGRIGTSDVFDVYVDKKIYLKKFEKDVLAFEMEAAALFAIGKHLGVQTACLLTVVDSVHQNESITALEREQSLDAMIQLALDAIVL